jgi:hypothetical protein
MLKIEVDTKLAVKDQYIIFLLRRQRLFAGRSSKTRRSSRSISGLMIRSTVKHAVMMVMSTVLIVFPDQPPPAFGVLPLGRGRVVWRKLPM